MKSLFSFIVKPKTSRYNNSKDIEGKELVLNTEMSNHKFVSREGIVLETPLAEKTDIQKGDTVIVHHNVFRRFNDIQGKEVNSKKKSSLRTPMTRISATILFLLSSHIINWLK